MGQAKELAVDEIKHAAKRLWEEFDSGALQIAEQRAKEFREKTWDHRWWTAIANELRRQFYG